MQFLLKNAEIFGTSLSFLVFYFKMPFLIDVSITDINAAMSTTAAFFSLVGSLAGTFLTCAKIAEKWFPNSRLNKRRK